ncbi:MAG: FAD-dependent oxidoreductase [Gemmatimonadetes bacterium]|nr:FAD-dependent oxidoreductase [Gemmatimonadota bacterium]MYB59649.1 FAD-dependent oxidoreductase [Gemmatimonadota bacterium]MYD60865.1 FAD-dependent oxidoreductase [Gemmatimonadota bacterium]
MEHMKENVDVLVIGGGTAGTIAAVQAGRTGLRTALIESGSQLGGVTTTGGVSFPGLFHAWGKQIIAGIGWELVTKAVALDSRKLPDFSVPPERHWMHQIRINGPVYAALVEEACTQAGVKLHFYEIPARVSETDTGWTVETTGKNMRRTIWAKQLIDCTGGANIVGQIGFPRLREQETQPGTLIFELGGYNVESLDEEVIQAHFSAAIKDGRLQHGDVMNPQVRFISYLRKGGNAQHVFGADASTSDRHTKTNIAGRQALLRILRFVRSLPGCENACVLKAQAETAVRETYRIVGDVQITHEDYTSGRFFDDAVSYSFYPIDLHDRDGIKPRPLSKGIVPTVPLRALIPKESRNLLVAGRSVSSDRLANSALRVQASSMAMGQAVGAAAALSVRLETTPREVPISDLRELLLSHGAVVPGLDK